jgi:hypothetical protein
VENPKQKARRIAKLESILESARQAPRTRPLINSHATGDEVYIAYAGNIFRGTVVRVDTEIQVETKCAALISRAWKTLLFHADGSALVGIAQIVVPQSMAQVADFERRSDLMEEGAP